MAGAEIKVSVNLANKNKVKAKNFIIPIFYFPIFFLRSLPCYESTTSSSVPISFFFEDFL